MRRGLLITALAAVPLLCCASAAGAAATQPAAGSAAASATGQWAVESTGGLSGTSNDVSCGSAASCMAVGSYNSLTSSDQADYWNGSTWTPQPLPAYMSGVSCASASSCMAVGELGPSQFSNGSAAAALWNGSSWTSTTIHVPSTAVQSFLTAISCASVMSCLAVGEYGNNSDAYTGLTEHWNGVKWNLQSAATPVGLDSVSCVSARNCTAVGNYYLSAPSVPEAEHWNGSTWTAQTLPAVSNGYLYSISCPSAASCTAVGSMEEPGVDIFASLAERWTSGTWTVQPTPAPSTWIDSQLYGVSCVSATDCTTVGVFVYQNSRRYARALIEHGNGSTWTQRLLGQPEHQEHDTLLNAVWCGPAGGCQAVGYVPPAGVRTTGSAGPVLAAGN
jgi:hypothetical protein